MRWLAVLLGLVLVVRWCRADDAAIAPGGSGLQAAVLRDGFAVMEDTGERHVLELDRDGHRRRRLAVPVTTEARVVGASAGTAIGFVDGGKLKVALVTGDGKLGKPSTWGRSVQRLCDGAATNEHRFAIGWLERDGGMGVVHGPTRKASAAGVIDPSQVEPAGRSTWCAVTSAGDHIAVFWREGTRTFMSMCNVKGCLDAVRVPVDKKDEVLAVGCLVHGCVIALRGPQGEARVGWMSDRGKVGWVKPLPTTSAVTIVGAGSRALALGFVSAEGAQVVRISREGSMSRAWADPSARRIPAIAWAGDHLLVAARDGSGVATEVIAVPE